MTRNNPEDRANYAVKHSETNNSARKAYRNDKFIRIYTKRYWTKSLVNLNKTKRKGLFRNPASRMRECSFMYNDISPSYEACRVIK